jgi:hypothetical protein
MRGALSSEPSAHFLRPPIGPKSPMASDVHLTRLARPNPATPPFRLSEPSAVRERIGRTD